MGLQLLLGTDAAPCDAPQTLCTCWRSASNATSLTRRRPPALRSVMQRPCSWLPASLPSLQRWALW